MNTMEERMANIEQTLVRIETNLDTFIKQTADHEMRIRCLESKGGKRWDALVGQIIGLAAVGFFGWVIGQSR